MIFQLEDRAHQTLSQISPVAGWGKWFFPSAAWKIICFWSEVVNLKGANNDSLQKVNLNVVKELPNNYS